MEWLLPSKHFILIGILIILLLNYETSATETSPMSKKEREALREESRDMFYHAYRAYMENAYPADELMPLSCQGRYRGLQPSRGDMDDILGNFSLTLIDTLDTLVILGDLEEFEHGVKLIIRDVSFDTDVVVSVFETNIRVLGGLLSGHILAEYLKETAGILKWYQNELLDMAKDLGYRLLPAFNTTTGIPYAKVNLKHGLKMNRLVSHRETCTACAGTMILEMAALSRLTGEPIFEEKSHRAMDELWKMRHRSSDLMGTVLNVHSGDWIRRDSGVGAGIDSYYEYCLKAYILLGDDRYLRRFNKHYDAVMKYISQGPMLLDVHMHRPHTNSRNFMDALLAFWPGLQVLKGDIKPAVETHEMLYQVMQLHNFIPEAFTTDFQVHWGQHPLRPEFLESTYFLHRATNDPYYLEVGRKVLKSLQKYARVPCGYAAVNDVRTGLHEDRMDSFVLAETFKYLFLLFSDENELILDLNDFIFTTEAHLLPLSLAKPTNYTISSLNFDTTEDDESNFARVCPATIHLLPETLRKPLRNMVDDICPKKKYNRRLTAAEFQVTDPKHLSIVKDMGINILSLSDGRIQLLHSFSSARSISDAEDGMIFMQEMLQLSRAQADQPEASPQGVHFKFGDFKVVLSAGPSHFGPELRGQQQVVGQVVLAQPFRACDSLNDSIEVKNKIVVMERGDCMFVNKARRIQKAGAIAGIVVDNVPGSSAATSPFFAMSGDGVNDVKIPVVFLFTDDAVKLRLAMTADPTLEVTIGELTSVSNEGSKTEDTVLQKIKVAVDEINTIRNKMKTTIDVSIDNFRAVFLYRMKTIKIQYKSEKSITDITKYDDDDSIPVNPKWLLIRDFILETLFQDNEKIFYITPSMLSLCYKEYSGASDVLESELKTQIIWLLTQLQKHLNKNPNMPLRNTKTSKNGELGDIKNVEENILKQFTQLSEKVNSLLEEMIGKIETKTEGYIEGGSTTDKSGVMKSLNDDIVIDVSHLPKEIIEKIENLKHKMSNIGKETTLTYQINRNIVPNKDTDNIENEKEDEIVLANRKINDEL
ncbi:ER degradation-enhancing alpha-mannosidase-like protein 3 [Chrysoperla carnea]|uniref:ER degradation-enhancing alpha-mannosidase-like protein 3 n=1 Tax=Chrysoperla carnea TaxID=189513 RepID=UPI001D076E0E|nr:ER degradation-enhancing alpha-mannosidase-like protein 3 [Chrysoperla carnea]